jgi:hypothetical protein
VISEGHTFLFDENIVKSVPRRDHMPRWRSSASRQTPNALITGTVQAVEGRNASLLRGRRLIPPARIRNARRCRRTDASNGTL